jgi:hypothetical protein
MKKVFYKKDIVIANCYNDKTMSKVISMITNGDYTRTKGTVFEILDAKFPTTDKYWFVLNNCGATKKQMGNLALNAASIALVRYEELNPDDNYVVDILDILRASHLTSKRLNTLMVSYKDGLQSIVTESVDDTKYIAIGMTHLMDAIHSINEKKETKEVIDYINSSMSYFIKGLVSRDDLKEELINELRNLFK